MQERAGIGGQYLTRSRSSVLCLCMPSRAWRDVHAHVLGLAVLEPHAHAFDRAFYAKLAGVSFVIGAAFEAFMLKTDFYAKVVHIEAERRFLAEQRREGEGSRDVGSRSAS